jgi:hypothetical protein
MSASAILPAAAGRWRPLCGRGARAFGLLPAIVLLPCTSLLIALEMPSKPFLEKNSFYLSSAGFRVRLANDPASNAWDISPRSKLSPISRDQTRSRGTTAISGEAMYQQKSRRCRRLSCLVSIRHFLLALDPIRKPVPTFRDHARH